MYSGLAVIPTGRGASAECEIADTTTEGNKRWGTFIPIRLATGWATTAEDPTGYHSSPLQIGKRGYNLQVLTKIDFLNMTMSSLY